MPALISLIIPVYNTEEFLHECLESVSAQTYPHFECILVDDGSTDRSAGICERFCGKDARFRLLKQENRGLPNARNRGLEEAKGEYVCFMDSDDAVHPEALQTALSALESGPYDWAMFDYTRESVPDGSWQDRSATVLDSKMALDGILEEHHLGYFVVWNKLYTRRIIGEIRFRDVLYTEDICFNYEVYRRTRSAVRIHRSLYYWRIREGSLTWNWSPDRRLIRFKSLFMLEVISRKDPSPLRAQCLKRIYRKLLVDRFHLTGTDAYPEFRSLAKKMIQSTFREYLSNKDLSLREKLQFMALWPCPHVVKALLKAKGN